MEFNKTGRIRVISYSIFKNILSDEQHMLKSEIVVLNAQIPVSFYVINEYNNVLKISGTGILTTTITIETGNYNANTN